MVRLKYRFNSGGRLSLSWIYSDRTLKSFKRYTGSNLVHDKYCPVALAKEREFSPDCYIGQIVYAKDSDDLWFLKEIVIMPAEEMHQDPETKKWQQIRNGKVLAEWPPHFIVPIRRPGVSQSDREVKELEKLWADSGDK